MDPVLDGKYVYLVVIATAATIVVGGAVVIWGRGTLKSPAGTDASPSFIRSWIAIVLVSGLVLFCAFSFAMPDSSLRNTLFGGLLANVGAAVAFYFASKTSDQARQDILGATFGTTQVPDLVGKTVVEAKDLMATSPLMLVVTPAGAAGNITAQATAAGTVVRQGFSLNVTAAA